MKPLRCWFGRHAWTVVPTKDGDGIVECRRCARPMGNSSQRYGSGGWPSVNDSYRMPLGDQRRNPYRR